MGNMNLLLGAMGVSKDDLESIAGLLRIVAGIPERLDRLEAKLDALIEHNADEVIHGESDGKMA